MWRHEAQAGGRKLRFRRLALCGALTPTWRQAFGIGGAAEERLIELEKIKKTALQTTPPGGLAQTRERRQANVRQGFCLVVAGFSGSLFV